MRTALDTASPGVAIWHGNLDPGRVLSLGPSQPLMRQCCMAFKSVGFQPGVKFQVCYIPLLHVTSHL